MDWDKTLFQVGKHEITTQDAAVVAGASLMAPIAPLIVGGYYLYRAGEQSKERSMKGALDAQQHLFGGAIAEHERKKRKETGNYLYLLGGGAAVLFLIILIIVVNR